MTDEEYKILKANLAKMREEHRDLDAAIGAMNVPSTTNQLRLTRLKKRKLQLRDQIAHIEDAFLPDIIA